MSGLLIQAQRWLKRLKYTPFHPQWLLGRPSKNVGWVQRHARGRVLDIGCADRWIEQHLPQECVYIGLDYPTTGGLLYGSKPDAFADACQLPISDASIDTVILFEVLEHLRQPIVALTEIARVLRPGGKLLLTVPLLYPVHDAPHDYQRYTSHGLVREMEVSGLGVVSIKPGLGSAETAGLLFNLALAGMVAEAIDKRKLSAVLLPAVLIAIPAINLLSWLLGKLLPSWPALTAGYRVLAFKQ